MFSFFVFYDTRVLLEYSVSWHFHSCLVSYLKMGYGICYKTIYSRYTNSTCLKSFGKFSEIIRGKDVCSAEKLKMMPFKDRKLSGTIPQNGMDLMRWTRMTGN